MKGRILILIASLLFLSFEGYSQSNATTWRSLSLKNLKNGEEHPYTCSFKIYPNSRIEWVQGTSVFSFTLTATEGKLPDEGPGAVTYQLTKEGKSGKVIVQRNDAGETVLILDLTEGDGPGAHLSFNVSRQ